MPERDSSPTLGFTNPEPLGPHSKPTGYAPLECYDRSDPWAFTAPKGQPGGPMAEFEYKMLPSAEPPKPLLKSWLLLTPLKK